MKLINLLDNPTPTVAELAKKYKTDPHHVQAQLTKGIKVELEHTSHEHVARRIALVHLGERLDYYTQLAQIDEQVINNEQGWGKVPNNQNVDYLGMRVRMKPSMFLKLAAPLERADAHSVKDMVTHLNSGGTVASPWLVIHIPDAWEQGDYDQAARVTSHEGRNRMYAIHDVQGDAPVEVHVFLGGGLRARHILSDWVDHMMHELVPQGQKTPQQGPWFTPVSHSVQEAWSRKYKKSINCANPKGFSQRAHCAGRKARSAHKKTKSASVSEATTRTSKSGAPGTLKAKISGPVTCYKVKKLKQRSNATPHDVSQANWFINMHGCSESTQLTEIFREPAQHMKWNQGQHGDYQFFETEFAFQNKRVKVGLYEDYDQISAKFVARNTDLDLPPTYKGYHVVFSVNGSTDATGELGTAASKLFAQVVSVLKGFLSTHTWDYVFFVGGENSRDRLYDALAHLLANQVGAKVATYRSDFLIYKPFTQLTEAGGVGLVVPGVNMPAGIHPDEIRRQARKWGFKVSAHGVPPVARTDGKI